MSKRKTSARLRLDYSPYQQYQIESSGIGSFTGPQGDVYYLMSSTDPEPFPESPGNGWEFVHGGADDWTDSNGTPWVLVATSEQPPKPRTKRAKPPEPPPTKRARVRYSARTTETGIREVFPIVQIPASRVTIADVDQTPAKGSRPPKGAIGRIKTDHGVQWLFPPGADVSGLPGVDLAYVDISAQRGSYDTRARSKVGGRPRKVEPLGEGRQGGKYARTISGIARAFLRAQTGR